MKIEIKPIISITAADVSQTQDISKGIGRLLTMTNCNSECEVCPFYDETKNHCIIRELNHYGIKVMQTMERCYEKQKRGN